MKTTGAAPSRPEDWLPTFEDQKHYPHFDAPLKISEIRKIVNDPVRVAQNAFFPLIQYEKKWQPFRSSPVIGRPEKKARKIRYASRRDAYIYARYRRILSPLYERQILADGISDVPIAYRKIKGGDGKGKCNIDFAKDVFSYIKNIGDCYVITLDISKFFESLDHIYIEKCWKQVLNVDILPDDHQAVFNSLTRYRWVDRTEAYRRLGFFGEKFKKSGEKIEGFLIPFSEMPKQICKPADFRENIAGNGSQSSIIQQNDKPYGIPQGTPISDLIANIYMRDFDILMKAIALKNGGKAFRYSDDILLVIKTDGIDQAKKIEFEVRNSISNFGAELKIKESKSSIHQFIFNNNGIKCKCIQGSGKNGLEYLGFRFDGSRIYLRDSTLANLKRKMTFAGRIRAQSLKKRYSNLAPHQLIEKFNFDEFFQTFMRVEEFDKSFSVRRWTFWTYVRRANQAFGPLGNPISKQLKFLKPDGRRLIERELSN